MSITRCVLFLLFAFAILPAAAQKAELTIPSEPALTRLNFEFTKDGKFLLTSSWDRSIKIYDLESKREVYNFWSHNEKPCALAIASDSRTVVSGDDAGKILVWDLYSGKITHTINEGDVRISTISIAPDDKTFLCADEYGVVSEYDLASGRLLLRENYHDFQINKLRFINKGSEFYSVAPDEVLTDTLSNFRATTVTDKMIFEDFYLSTARLIDAVMKDGSSHVYYITKNPSQLRIKPLENSQNDTKTEIIPLDFEPLQIELLSENRLLVACANQESVLHFIIFDLTSRKVASTFATDINVLEDYPTGNFKMGKIPGSEQFGFILGYNSSMLVLDLISGKVTDLIPDKTDIQTGAYLEDDAIVLAGGHKKLKRWDLKNNTIDNLSVFDDRLWQMQNLDNNVLLSVNQSDRILNWNKDLKQITKSIDVPGLYLTLINPDSTLVAVTSTNKKLLIFQLPDYTLVNSIDVKGEIIPSAVAWFDNHSLGYCTEMDGDNSIILVNVNSKTEIKYILAPTKYRTQYLAFIDRSSAVISDFDKVLNVDLKSGTIKQELVLEHRGGVREIQYSSKLDKVLVWYEDGEILFLNPHTLATEKRLTGHKSTVNSLNFTTDYSSVVTTSLDNTIRIWDYNSAALISTLSLFSNNEWVVVHENGLFDASPQAMKDIYYVVNDPTDTDEPWKIIELEQLKHRYYQPDLLQIQLGYKKEELRTPAALVAVPLAPKISLQNSGGKLEIKLKNLGGGIGRVVLFVEDAEVIADVRPAGKQNADQQLLEISVDLSNFSNRYKAAGPSSIKVIAWNKDEWISTPPQYLEYQPMAPKGSVGNQVADAKGDTPRLFGLVVGTSDYTGNSIDLHYAAKDAADYSEALKRTSANLFGKENVVVELYSTEINDPKRKPSRKNILNALEELAVKIKPSDVVIVYLSGHGVNYGGAEGDFYYLTQEASGADAAYLADESVRNTSAISSTELTGWLNQLTAGKKIMILDACASGKAAEKMYAAKDVPASQIRALDRMQDRTGFYILAGSAADAVSYESSVYGQGLLTYSLLKAMKGSALRVDGGEEYVDVHQLFQFAVEQVPELSKNIGGIQKPFFKSPDNQQSFDIGKVDIATKQAIVISEPKPVFIEAVFSDSDALFDELELTEKFNAFLHNSASEGKGADFAFIRAKEYPGAYRVTGSYTSDDEFIYLKYRIISDKKSVGEIRDVTFPNQVALDENISKLMLDINKSLR